MPDIPPDPFRRRHPVSVGMKPLPQCPVCPRSPLHLFARGEVVVVAGEQTCLGWGTHFDEHGRLHYHDPNEYQLGFKCSNGHKWGQNEYRRCWCGWTAADQHHCHGAESIGFNAEADRR